MKIIATVLISFFFLKHSFCQDINVVPQPNILLSDKQIKQKMIFSRIGNYYNVVGRDFGKFYASDNTGKSISEKNLIGKITFVDFWFDGCSPCHLVFNPLNALYTKYISDSNFQVVSFTLDSKEELKKNIIKYGLLYRNIPVSSDLCHKLMGPDRGFSCIYIVDENGKIVLGHSGVGQNGADPFKEIFIPKIDSLINNMTTSKASSK